jgi:preprotein translocase subunit SecD
VSESPLPQPQQPPPSVNSRNLLIVLGALGVVVLVTAVTCGVVGFLFRDRIFDLGDPGTTTLTVEAVTAGGDAPDRKALERTRDVLADRIEAAEFDRRSVEIDGDRRLVLKVDGGGKEDVLRSLAGTGDLRIRRVLGTVPDQSTAGTPALPPDAGPVPSRAEVAARLGSAYQIAEGITAPGAPDPATTAALAPFAALTPAQVAALPQAMQYAVPAITCPQLAARPAGAAAATDQLVACARADQPTKYLMDVAKVSAADIDAAEASFEQSGGQWVIAINFTSTGQQRWTDLTREASAAGQGNNQVAIVLDDVVISAPEVLDVLTGSTQISGAFTRDSAMVLAAQLNSEPLPLVLRAVN